MALQDTLQRKIDEVELGFKSDSLLRFRGNYQHAIIDNKETYLNIVRRMNWGTRIIETTEERGKEEAFLQS